MLGGGEGGVGEDPVPSGSIVLGLGGGEGGGGGEPVPGLL